MLRSFSIVFFTLFMLAACNNWTTDNNDNNMMMDQQRVIAPEYRGTFITSSGLNAMVMGVNVASSYFRTNESSPWSYSNSHSPAWTVGADSFSRL